MWGKGSLILRIEAQMPTILWGHNARLIKSPQEFNDAFGWLRFLLNQVLYSPDGNPLLPLFPDLRPAFEFTRIDCPWHFPASLNLRMLMAQATHPRAKRCASFNNGETMSLSSSALEIIAYDKCAKMRRKGGAFVVVGQSFDRLEISIKKAGLAAGPNRYSAADGCGRSHLTIDWCKYVLRRALDELDIGVIDTSGLSPTIPGFFAACQALHPDRGIPELYCRVRQMKGISKQRLLKSMRKELEHCCSIIPFDEILPSTRNWPSPPEIVWLEKEQAHAAWLNQQAAVGGNH